MWWQPAGGVPSRKGVPWGTPADSCSVVLSSHLLIFREIPEIQILCEISEFLNVGFHFCLYTVNQTEHTDHQSDLCETVGLI